MDKLGPIPRIFARRLDSQATSEEIPVAYDVPSPKELELVTRPILKIKELEVYGTNIRVVELINDGLGIFKTGTGSMSIKRERAAYLVSRFLNFNLVPPTVVRTIGFETGSLQEFILGAKIWIELGRSEDEPYGLDNQKLKRQLFSLWIFDYLVFNTDRHEWNLLLKNDKVHAIDNEASFRVRNFSWYWHGHLYDFHNKPVPDEIIGNVDSFLQDASRQDLLKQHLGELLSEEEAQAFFSRVQHLGMVFEKGSVIGRGDLGDFSPS